MIITIIQLLMIVYQWIKKVKLNYLFTVSRGLPIYFYLLTYLNCLVIKYLFNCLIIYYLVKILKYSCPLNKNNFTIVY